MSELKERMDRLVALKEEIDQKEKEYWTGELRREVKKYKESDIEDIASDVWSLHCKGITGADDITVIYNGSEYYLRGGEFRVDTSKHGVLHLGTVYYCYKESDYLGYKKYLDEAPAVIEIFKKRAEEALDAYEAKIREKILKIGGRA